MKNGWVKIFSGDYITGAEDENVSWSQTRLDGLRGVQLFHDGQRVELIRGIGEYNYSEDFEVQVGTNDHTKLAKRIQYKSSKGWETIELDLVNQKILHYMSENKI